MTAKMNIKEIHEETLGEDNLFLIRLARWEEDETEEAEFIFQGVTCLSEASRVVRRYIGDLKRPDTFSGGEVFTTDDDGERGECFAVVKPAGTVWGATNEDCWDGGYRADPNIRYVLRATGVTAPAV